MSDACIINYATGDFFRRGQNRLKQACMDVGYDGDFLLYNDENILTCPPQHISPYAFKPYSMKEAQKKGYRYILWCDASVFPEKSMDLAFEIIKDLGYLFFPGGFNTGMWCSDDALKTLGITREQAFEINHMIAGCQGLDLENAKAKAYLDRYYELSNDGITFFGVDRNLKPKVTLNDTYYNTNNCISNDHRVKGHRHDQTAASVIAWKLGMMDWVPNMVIYDQHGEAKRHEETIFVVRSA